MDRIVEPDTDGVGDRLGLVVWVVRLVILLFAVVALVGCSGAERSTNEVGTPRVGETKASGCPWTHPPIDDDPAVGSPSPIDRTLRRDDMRLRPAFLGRLLVPESWIVEHDGQCTATPSIAWVNPFDEREQVVHRMGMASIDDRSPRADPTSDIRAFLNWHDPDHTGGRTVHVVEGFGCDFAFEVETTDGYTLAGRWLLLGDTYAISSITVGGASGMVEEQTRSLASAVGWERDMFWTKGFEFSGKVPCQSFEEFVAGGSGPIGADMDHRPMGGDLWSTEIDNTCLGHLGSGYPERIRFDDGVWKFADGDIKDPHANRRHWLVPDGDGSSTHAKVAGVLYADLVPEEDGEPVLEVAVGVTCNAQAGTHADVQVLRPTWSGWERIGLPVDGFLFGLSAVTDLSAAGDGSGDGSLNGRELLHVVRPALLDSDGEYVDGETLCCATGRYENVLEWRDGAWSPVDPPTDPVPPARLHELSVFESLSQVNPTWEDCHGSDYGSSMPGRYREESGDDVRVSCDFRPDGLLTTFEFDIHYPLRGRAGVPDPIDDHVRRAVKKHIDRRLAEDLPESIFHRTINTPLPSQLEIDGEVVHQSDDLYSVAIDIYYYWPGAANGDPDFEGVTVFKPTGELLDLADLFDPSIEWLPRLVEIYDEVGAEKFPRCGRWQTDESDPETAFAGFVVTSTALRLYNYLAPNACGLDWVDVGYHRIAHLIDPAGPLAGLIAG